jgi:two-component system alkaline phosphatase synthesis response regulator PhoP
MIKKQEEIRKKILLAEDDATMVNLLKMLLELEGYSVVNPPIENMNIIQIARKELPDIILMDVYLGNQNGVDIVKKFREMADLRRIKIIMTSGMNLSYECIEAGADDFVQKPYMPDELLSKIKKQLPVEK